MNAHKATHANQLVTLHRTSAFEAQTKHSVTKHMIEYPANHVYTSDHTENGILLRSASFPPDGHKSDAFCMDGHVTKLFLWEGYPLISASVLSDTGMAHNLSQLRLVLQLCF